MFLAEKKGGRREAGGIDAINETRFRHGDIVLLGSQQDILRMYVKMVCFCFGLYRRGYRSFR